MVKKAGRKTNCWKKMYIFCLILILFSAVVYVELPGAQTTAVDYPHQANGCQGCHIQPAGPDLKLDPLATPPVNTVNDLCLTCHNDVAATLIKTHSSQNTSDTYGTWSVDCTTCHNPHKQEQAGAYGSEGYLPAAASTFLSTTAISGTDYSWIIRTGAAWTEHQWAGMLVIVNPASSPQVFHKIYDNTVDTITVEGPLADMQSGDTFAIVYGGLVKSSINYTKTNVTPNVNIAYPTKFFRNSGENSFTNGTDIPGAPSIPTKGICMACHTTTKYQKNDGTGIAHHQGEDCILCHSHQEGFKPTAGFDASSGPLDGLGNNSGLQVLGGQSWAPGDPLKALNDPDAAYDATTKTCKGVYCHSNGADGASRAYKTTPAWNGHLDANKCGSCHDDPPQYTGQAHYVSTGYMGKEGGHLVGMHFDGVYNGSSGLAAADNSSTGSHGNALYSSAISCNICHSGIVSDSTIDTYSMSNVPGSAFACSNCHNSGSTTKLQAGDIANKRLHVNGTKDVVLADAYTIKSKAQLRDGSMPRLWTRHGAYKGPGSYDSATLNSINYTPGTKTCVTACHLGKSVGWGDTGLKCSSCHTSL